MRARAAAFLLTLLTLAPLPAWACDELELRALRVLVEQLQLSRARGEAQAAEAIAKLSIELQKAREGLQGASPGHVLPQGGR